MHLQGGVLMANGLEGLAPDLWQRVRRLLQPESGAETAGLIGASIMPGVGEAIDIADIAAGIQDRDLGRIGLGAVGLALPFISGRTIRGARDLARAGGTPRPAIITPPPPRPAIITPPPPPPPVKGLEALGNSRLEKFFLDTQQGKATGSQWQAMLNKAQKSGVVPKGEMEWTGVTSLLGENPSRVFTRAELQKHMDDSGIKLKETWRGTPVNEFADWSPERRVRVTGKLTRRMHGLDRLEHQGLRRLTSAEKRANHAQARKIEQRIKDINEGVFAAGAGRPLPTTTKFGDSNMRIQGPSENYRELTVQLEPEGQPLMKARKELGMGYDGTASMPPEIRVKYDALTEQINNLPGPTRFTKSHWPEDNVLVHLRMSDRVGVNPKTGKPEKVLFIEEVQSDWHEKGRKQGYKDSKVDQAFYEQLQSAERAVEDVKIKHGMEKHEAIQQWDRAARSKTELLSGDYTTTVKMNAVDLLVEEQMRLDDIIGEFNIAQKKADDIDWAWMNSQQDKIVPGPFKDTDEWVELGMRRAIQEGVDGGYDRVAWASGEQVATLPANDLQKHISKIDYNPDTGRLEAWDLQGNPAVDHHNITPDQLPEYLGKERAEQLMKAKPQDRYVPKYEIKKHKPRLPTNEEIRNMRPPPPADSSGRVDYSYRYSVYDPDGYRAANARSREEAQEFIERQWSENHNIRTIEGDDLAIGGQKMIYFYDKMVPNAVKNAGKQVGGIKIEDINLRPRSAFIQDKILPLTDPEALFAELEAIKGINQSFAITPEMRNIAGRSGQRLWGTGGLVGLGLAARQQGNN